MLFPSAIFCRRCHSSRFLVSRQFRGRLRDGGGVAIRAQKPFVTTGRPVFTRIYYDIIYSSSVTRKCSKCTLDLGQVDVSGQVFRTRNSCRSAARSSRRIAIDPHAVFLVAISRHCWWRRRRRCRIIIRKLHVIA